MTNSPVDQTKRRVTFKKILLWALACLFLILAGSVYFYYKNLNRILSEALLKSFNSNIASDVYELRFTGLNVNFVLGSIKVKDVELLPREKPLNDYPYINSWLRLTTKELLLSEVEIYTLLRENRLKLNRIKIENPILEVNIDDKIPIFLPFSDSTAVADTANIAAKHHITKFILKKFDLIDASLHLENHAKERNLNFKNLNINLRDLLLDQRTRYDLMKYSAFSFTIDEISGYLNKESIKQISLKDYGITIDSMEVKKSVDTMIYHFKDFNLGLRDLHVITADNAFQISLQTFSISYADSIINLEKLLFKPNITEAEMQKRFKFQHNTGFSGEIGKLQITGVNFDSLMYKRKLLVDAITLDSVSVSLFKNKTLPVDKKHLPVYLGQTAKSIPMPLLIKQVNATNVDLVSREIKPDTVAAEAHINQGIVHVSNITNMSTAQPLSMQIEALLENKAPFKVSLNFDYLKPEFSYKGSFGKFKLKDINPLITSYAPAKISEGTIDVIDFSGKATEKKASGTMKFLYHDLKMEVQLKKKAAWKNAALSFAANTVVSSSNPVAEKMPPKVVDFQIERDMNKAFVNVVIKSALVGLKETVIMSKESRKAYNEAKKRAKEEQKKLK